MLHFHKEFQKLYDEVLREQDDDASAIIFRCMINNDKDLSEARQNAFDDLYHCIDLKDEVKALDKVQT